MLTSIDTTDTLLDRAIRVMDRVAGDDAPVTFSTLLADCGFNRATLAKILRILCQHEMLMKRDGGYVMGARPMRYVGTSEPAADRLARSRPHLSALSERFGVTAQFIRVWHDHSVCLDKVTHAHAPSMRAVGCVVPEQAIHPWRQLALVHDSEGDPMKTRRQRFADAVRTDAGRTRYVPRMPTRKQIDSAFDAAMAGVGDDRGLFIPNSRRLAAALDPPDATPPRDFVVVGLFPGATTDVGALTEALRDAAARITATTPPFTEHVHVPTALG